ncbi:hypothetical protein BN1723_015637 [Verticillium longisporum]|uniref:Sey1/RHD3-like three-helix bundle domain-containing protein n=1 Tax=Verticillium longisporum TaxID=100787 RepID=A0A0G4N0V3_VERLO|nr:hypothetical protein BN1723_015637 [Verticillium longisporum]
MSFLEQVLSHPSFVLLGFLALATLVVAGFGIRTELCVRRLGGVRAPIIASNPVTALSVFVKLGRAQAKHKLPELFTSLCNSATPGKARCIEITFFGRHRFILTNEPEHIKTILTSKFVDFGKGPVFHEGWAPFLGDSIFTTDGKVWQDNRSLIRPMFVRDRVRDLAIFEHWTDKMVSKLPASGMTVDVMDLFYRMTLDVTTDFLLGTSVNSLDNHKHHFAEAFNEVQRMQMIYTILSAYNTHVDLSAKRSAIGGVAQVPLYFYALLLALGWNEIWAVVRNPFLFIFLIMLAGGTYVAYTMNMLGPMMQMANAAATQGVDIGKQKLRDFIVNSDMARQALNVPERDSDSVLLDRLDSKGKKQRAEAEEVEEI